MSKYDYPCSNGGDIPAEIPEGHYSRLCAQDYGDWDPFDEQELALLADTMMESKRPPNNQDTPPRTTIPSGYVYFGQLIDHDVTRDIRNLHDAPPIGAGPDVEQTLNYRTARLDLDFLYGRDPSKVPCIYEADQRRLRLGPTKTANGVPGRPNDDLPRTIDGTACVIDPRSDENLIIGQMHVLFAKFHNAVLRLLKDQPDLAPPGGGLFDRARRFVTWHYQYIVLYDFLPKIVQNYILGDVEAGVFRLFPRPFTPLDCPVSIPVEFAAAAFRFGHSMVHTQYRINNHQPPNVGLCSVLGMTKQGGMLNGQLAADWVVDWDNFFPGGKTVRGQVNLASPIDTYLADHLHQLGTSSVSSFRAQSAVTMARDILPDQTRRSLPLMTLTRGLRMRLPSGQEFVDWCNNRLEATRAGYHSDKIEPQIMFPDLQANGAFQGWGFAERTPLWYYLLRESATNPPEEPIPPETYQDKLGWTSSLIVAEVIHQLLNADAGSFNNAPSKWNPKPFHFCGIDVRLDSIRGVVNFVQAATDVNYF
jgi:hypothetical protein